MTMQPSRREFTHATLASLLTYSLLETLCDHEAIGAKVKPIMAKWLRDLNQLGLDVKDNRLKQIVWQKKVEELFKQVQLPELLKMVDFERLIKDIKLPNNGAKSLRFRFSPVDGAPKKLVFGRQIFGLKKGRSVVPHGHNNMATAFLILKGNFHGRHYDRLEDEPQHMIIKPTIDRKFGVGGFSTVSDFKDNVHWFEAVDEPAFIFNIHVLGVKSGKSDQRTGRVYVDPKGEKISGGRLRARKIDHKQAHKLYG